MVLLDAASVLRRDGLRFTLLLVGDGPCRADIEDRIRELELGSMVRTLGSLVHADAIALIGAADGMVLPSFAEGLPLAVLEAQALGTPIVAATAGGVAEVIQHDRTGLLVRSHDHQALAVALRRLLEDPQAARSRARAGLTHADQFDAPVIAARYEHVYNRIA